MSHANIGPGTDERSEADLLDNAGPPLVLVKSRSHPCRYVTTIGAFLLAILAVAPASAADQGVKFFECGVDYFGTECKKEAKEEKPKTAGKPRPSEGEGPAPSGPAQSGREGPRPSKAERFEAELKHLAEEPTEANADALAVLYVEGLDRAKLADELLSDALRRRLSAADSVWKVTAEKSEGKTEKLDGPDRGLPTEVTYDLTLERPTLLVFCHDRSALCMDQLNLLKSTLGRIQKNTDLFVVTPPDRFTGAIQAGVPRRVNAGLYARFDVSAVPTFAVLAPESGKAILWRGWTGRGELERKVRNATRR